MAKNCWLVLTGIEVAAGDIAIDFKLLVESDAATVNVTLLFAAPDCAVIVVFPAAIATANPAALIVDTLEFEELQLTELVRSALLPSLYVPVATNC